MEIVEGDSVFVLTAADDGSGDYLVSVEARAQGFSGHADGHVAGAEWHSFVRQLEVLERERKGAAHLISAMPGEFDIEVKAVDSRGHLGVSGVLSYQRVGDAEWCVQRLHFAFGFDPSKLAAFANAASAQQRAAADVRNARG